MKNIELIVKQINAQKKLSELHNRYEEAIKSFSSAIDAVNDQNDLTIAAKQLLTYLEAYHHIVTRPDTVEEKAYDEACFQWEIELIQQCASLIQKDNPNKAEAILSLNEHLKRLPDIKPIQPRPVPQLKDQRLQGVAEMALGLLLFGVYFVVAVGISCIIAFPMIYSLPASIPGLLIGLVGFVFGLLGAIPALPILCIADKFFGRGSYHIYSYTEQKRNIDKIKRENASPKYPAFFTIDKENRTKLAEKVAEFKAVLTPTVSSNHQVV